MVTINIKKSREFRDTKRNIQLILISSLVFFSVIIGYFNGFNRFNDIRRILRDIINDDDYPHEDSGSFQGNIIEDEHLYPPNLFTDKEIAQWAWILHFIGMFYMFLGISIVCDDYFVPTLETIVEKLEMSDDTAGATWLAAGGSAPELFTSFIGIFIAKSDVGFGTIVGSAVFNVLFVVGMCAFFTPGNLPLNWWPFARDLAYYIFSLGILSIFFGGTSPGEIEWWESLTLFLFYIIYVVLMGYNQNIKTWFFSKFINTDNKSILLKEYKSKEELVQQNITGYSSFIPSNNDKNNKNIAVTVETENNNDIDDDLKSDNTSDFEYEYCDGPDITYPVYGTYFDKFMFIIKYPIMISTYMTLADVTRESQKKYWPWTFIVSLIWLGAFAYFMVWWAVIVGHCWNIPDEIMGLTFLAAGTSIPELFSCILVAKKGKADMAISGSIGSNIFDVLVGLSLPWFFYSIIMGNGTVKVEADRLFLSLILLVIILIALTIAIHCNKWVLTHSLGFIMFLLWIFFVTQDLLRHFLDLDQKWFGSSLVTK